MSDWKDADHAAAARMLLALAAVKPEQRLDTLALVCKVVVEGHLPRFENREPRGGER